MIKGNKRLAGETFKKYKARIKDEAKKVKKYLRGRYIWLSTDLYDGPRMMPTSHIIAEGLGTYSRDMGAIGTRR